jgi:murein L,D-transpeptidase YafK
MLAASGKPGPKLAEGDLQVPEGLYRIESLNPNSSYHLSLRLDYPNEFDRDRAHEDGRIRLGGDIMIHGSNVSIGCIAIGDAAIEEVFVLAAGIGHENVEVILSPSELRTGSPSAHAAPVRPWVPGLYESIRSALSQLPLSTSANGE